MIFSRKRYPIINKIIYSIPIPNTVKIGNFLNFSTVFLKMAEKCQNCKKNATFMEC